MTTPSKDMRASEPKPWLNNWIGALLLMAVVVAAYWPAMSGGFIWDDDLYVTKNATLHDGHGLWQIWFMVDAVPQYYPMVYTTFWLEHQLWGINPLGFHLVNVLLHAAAAILLWQVLVRLEVPGAWLAAVIFAIHPVEVESVAWITERKNVLSAVFYFSAALAYLRFVALEKVEGSNRLRWYWYCGAVGLFVGALLSKTVTCSLPAALLLVCWWKRDCLRWRWILPLSPFFVIGMALGLATVWIEKYHVGAQGAEWSFTFGERCLIAGRALWFYAGKLVWPTQLTFSYSHWSISVDVWWQWLFPIAVVGVMVGLWLARCRIGKGPLVAVLFFAGTLGPALGFVNVYPMRYSFVADHFQYLASVGLIVLGAAGLSRMPKMLSAGIVAVLMVLTWQQTHIYRNLNVLWSDTLVKNPDCWMAHANLGHELHEEGRNQAAEEHFRNAIKINPNSWEAQCNLGVVLAEGGRFDEAIEHYCKALQVKPDYYFALNGLGNALAAKGQVDEAIKNYYWAIQVGPYFSDAYNNLGIVLADKGLFDEAIKNYKKAVEINPNYWEALDNLGIALSARGRFDEAIKNFRQAIWINSDCAKTHLHLGMAMGGIGDIRESMSQYQAALGLNPELIEALNNLAWIRAVSSDDGLRDGAEAVHLAEHACELTRYSEPMFLGTLAAAYAEVGRFSEAVSTAEKAERLAMSAGLTSLAVKNRQLLEFYHSGQPYRDPLRPNP